MTIAETGLPGSPKTSGAARCDPEPGRLAGPQRDAPEDLLDAERCERRPDVVVLTDRDAAADHRQLTFERPLDRRAGRVGVVADDRGADELGAGPLASGGDRVGVRVADRPWAQRLAGLLQLVAGASAR